MGNAHLGTIIQSLFSQAIKHVLARKVIRKMKLVKLTVFKNCMQSARRDNGGTKKEIAGINSNGSITALKM